jgi:hypothetical protein
LGPAIWRPPLQLGLTTLGQASARKYRGVVRHAIVICRIAAK